MLSFWSVQCFLWLLAREGRDVMKMRVLFIMAELTHSGAETMLRAIGSDLRARGVTAHILSTGENGEGAFSGQLRAAGYGVHHIAFRRHIGFFAEVWRLFRSQRYDVVHVHCERANFWLQLLAIFNGAQVFRSVHGVFHFDGGLRLRRSWQRWLSCRMGVVFTAPSSAVTDNERRRFGNDCLRLSNWIDLARFPIVAADRRDAVRRELGLTADEFVLLSVGSCHAVKNHGAVIEAMASLPDHVVYLHAGSGPLAAAEIEHAEMMGISDRVRWLGRVDDVSVLFPAVDVFVMPSTHEGLGLAAVEAMASGIACVLSRVDGLSELEPFFRAGAWCDTSAPSIAGAIIEVMAMDPETLHRQAAETAVHVRRVYGHEAGLEALLSLYGEGE